MGYWEGKALKAQFQAQTENNCCVQDGNAKFNMWCTNTQMTASWTSAYVCHVLLKITMGMGIPLE